VRWRAARKTFSQYAIVTKKPPKTTPFDVRLTMEMTVKNEQAFCLLAGMETFFSTSKHKALPIGLWPVFQRQT
jgi:hypothetical protein